MSTHNTVELDERVRAEICCGFAILTRTFPHKPDIELRLSQDAVAKLHAAFEAEARGNALVKVLG